MLDVEALHRHMNTMGRTKMTWPRLSRTSECLIIQRPWWGSRRFFARWMAENLPGFEFNRRKDWWEAGLSKANYRSAADACKNRLQISQGVEEWLNVGDGRLA